MKSDIMNVYDKLVSGGYQGSKLAKDAFTVYCFLSAREEDQDPNYFNDCFCYVVKNIYNTQTAILDSAHSRDVAFNMSIYGNLLKSDAFLYVPMLHGSGENEKRVGYLNDIPYPHDVKSRFSIEASDITQRHGGSVYSAGALEAFISGGAALE
jgi:hypothetical protein